MAGFRSKLAVVAATEPRYPIEAYEFLCQALAVAQRHAAKEDPADPDGPNHVSGRDLLAAARALAVEQFGMLAYAVFDCWGLKSTRDIGNMVYRMIDAGHWRQSPTDSLEDFDDVFDFRAVFVDEFVLEWEPID